MIGGLYRRDWGICMMSSSDSPSRGGTALLLALGAAAALLYARILPYPLIWDDRAFVSGQPFLADCRNLAEVLAPSSFTGVLVVRGAARPVWLASVLADACLAGGWTPAHRLVSAWWHALATMLLAFLARRLTGSLGAGLTAGALFAAHPLHAEVVAIVTFRSDALCLSFMLLSTVLFIEARGRSGAARYWAGAGALGAATLALLSKETAVVLPLLWALSRALRWRRLIWFGAFRVRGMRCPAHATPSARCGPAFLSHFRRRNRAHLLRSLFDARSSPNAPGPRFTRIPARARARCRACSVHTSAG
jgi:hypothetical protein